MRLTGLDSNDSHQRRKGEEAIKKEDIKDKEPKDDKKTRQTSTMTSFIKNHILTCAISHGSRASTTCLCGIDDITSSILDYSSRSSSHGQQHSSTSLRWTSPSGRMLPSIYLIFVLELKLEQQLKMASLRVRQPSRAFGMNWQTQTTSVVMMTSMPTSPSLKQTSLFIRLTLMGS